MLGSFAPRVGRYGRFLAWLVSDGLWTFRWRAGASIAAEGLGAGLELAAVALAFLYARALATGQPLQAVGRSWEARGSPSLLVATSAAVGVLLLGSAAGRHLGRLGILRVRRDYAEVCTQRVLESPAARGPDPLPLRQLQRAARSGAMYCGRIVHIVLKGVVPLLLLVASVAVLAYLQPWLTAGLGALAGLALVFLYRVNVRAVARSRQVEEESGPSARELRDRLADLRSGEEVAPVAAWPHTRRWLDATIGRVRSVSDGELVANTALAVILASLLGVLAYRAMARQGGWEAIVVYLIGLRYALVSFRGAARTLTSFNRFYPQARHYLDVVSGRSGGPEAPGGTDDNPDDDDLDDD